MWNWLTDYSRFPIRRYCGEWYEWEVVMHKWSEGTIGTCYVVIPLLMVGLYRGGYLLQYFGHPSRANKTAKATPGTYAMMAFVSCCGITHYINMLIFDVAMYPILGIALVATTLVSLFNIYLMLHAGAAEGLFLKRKIR